MNDRGNGSKGASDLYFRQVEDLWEDSDVIRVCYQRVQSLAAGHSGWYRLELVATKV